MLLATVKHGLMMRGGEKHFNKNCLPCIQMYIYVNCGWELLFFKDMTQTIHTVKLHNSISLHSIKKTVDTLARFEPAGS
jgi:hypothetical protein